MFELRMIFGIRTLVYIEKYDSTTVEMQTTIYIMILVILLLTITYVMMCVMLHNMSSFP